MITREILLRLGAAFVAGLIIGYERESHGRAAGLRTTMLTCVSAALAMILSEHLFKDSSNMTTMWKPDPARLAAGVLAGMGFLGGAVVIRHENAIRGVTTAAVLWFVTILGLAFGSGYILLGLLGTGIALIALFILPHFEAKIQKDWNAAIVITLQMEGVSDEKIYQELKALGLIIKKIDLDYHLAQKQKIIRCELRFKKTNLFDLSQLVIQKLAAHPGVLQVQWS